MFTIIGLALALVTVSCSKDVDLAPADGKVVLGVTLENDTRTALGSLDATSGKYDVVWSAGDKIAVNGVASEAVADTFVGTKSAQFALNGVEAPYSIIYPASVLNTGGNTITVPTVQPYTEGTFAPGTAVAVCYSETENMALLNLYSFFKLTIAQGEDTTALRSVAVKALGEEAISGVFSVDYKSAQISPVGGQSVINVMDVVYGADGKAVVYVAVPAGKYVAGFEVTVTDVANKTMSKKCYTAQGITLAAGELRIMPEFTYVGAANAESGVIVISTGAQLQQLAADYAEAGFDAKAIFANDIDMTDISSVSTFNVLASGVIDGQGYAIKNWTSTKGLVKENWGTVKNIVLDSSCNLTFDMTNTDMSTPHGFIADANLGLVSGCVNNADIVVTGVDTVKDRSIGTIVGVIGSTYPNDAAEKSIDARIENCINNGSLTVDLTNYSGGWAFIGGVAGSYYPHASISNGGIFNCVNNGALTVNSNNSYVISMGGVTGSAGKLGYSEYNYCTVENCINNGAVTYNANTPTGNLWVAGVAGVANADLVNVTNNGKVTIAAKAGTTIAKYTTVGGVTAMYAGNLTNVHNTADIEMDNINFGSARWSVAGVGAIKVNKNDANNTYAIAAENCTNSGNIDISFTTSAQRLHYVAGVFADVAYKAYYGGNATTYIDINNCKNSGNITVVNTGGAQIHSGGIVGYNDEGRTRILSNSVNSGAISVTGDIKATSTLGGIAGTWYGGFENCQSLGDLTLHGENAGPDYTSNNKTNVASVGGFNGRMGNAERTWNNLVLDCAISYEATNADNGIVFGLLQGDRWGAKIVEVTNVTVKKTTTVNGVAVTAEDLANHFFLVGRDQQSWDDRANSTFKIAEITFE